MKIVKGISTSFVLLATGVLSIQAQVKPVQKEGKYSFSTKELYFEVDPKTGGRVSSFKLEGKEVLFTDNSKGNNNWGSTFWPAPQSVWGWPPSDTLDKLPYSSTVNGNSLTVKSMPTKGKTNCAFEKTFTINEVEKSVSVSYKIENTSTQEIALGAWQITRVPSGGITFFPIGMTPSSGALFPLLKAQDDIAWFDYDSAFVAKDPNAVPKLFSDGSRGWLAHVSNDGYLLLFKFADTPAELKAPGEDEIEIYANPNLTYTEIEPFGPYTKIAPKSSSTWNIKWYVRKLPTSIARNVGSKALVDYVNALVK